MKPNEKEVLEYHQQTKHHFHRLARSPGYLDWANQPDPFRRYHRTRLVHLDKSKPLVEPLMEPLFDEAFTKERIPSTGINRSGISQFFFNSFALSAWKSAGQSSWPLRVNPSSGNLHPTEAYLICGPVEGLCQQPMVCHYAPKEHGLEVLAMFDIGLWNKLCLRNPNSLFFVVLTSIHWREAWKYGKRAFRYCQLDVGHAIGAINYSAAGLGWETSIRDDLSSDDLALLTGTFRKHRAEKEDPDVLLAVGNIGEKTHVTYPSAEAIQVFSSLDWQGQPSQLSPSHVDWDIDKLAEAVRKPPSKNPIKELRSEKEPLVLENRPAVLQKVIRQRRSAVAMDKDVSMSRPTFFRMFQNLNEVNKENPFAGMPWKAYIHLAIFVHRVDDLPPGLYFLVRDKAQKEAIEVALKETFSWKKPDGCPEALELYNLFEGDVQEIAQQISCSQSIACDGCFSLGMISEYQESLKVHGSWFYSRLYWEAGLIGQVLYLEAEAAGIRGTGIGCFFDDPMHELLGLKDQKYQDLYHFTVGGPIEDTRLRTHEPYPE